MVINLSEKPSLISHTIAQLRDVVLQKDRLRFRVLTERLGEIFAYEISKTLPYVRANVQSPLGVAECSVLGEQPILGTILRAGLPLHYGMLKFFEQADNAFIAAYRKHDPAGGPGFSIDLQYLACAALTGRTLIVADPMLATGRSMVMTIQRVLEKGKPKKIHIASIVASRVGVENIQKQFPDATVWVGAIDEELNPQSYIVPGLGDAGDLLFGEKIQR